MSKSYEQRTIGGGAAIHSVRGWKAGELGGTGRTDKGPTMAARASLRRLNVIREQVARGIEAAGSADAYYNAGGLAGPFGRSLGKAERKPRRKAEPKADRTEQLERMCLSALVWLEQATTTEFERGDDRMLRAGLQTVLGIGQAPELGREAEGAA